MFNDPKDTLMSQELLLYVILGPVDKICITH